MGSSNSNRKSFGNAIEATHLENLINTNVKRVSMGPSVPEQGESFVLLRFNNEKERNNFLQTDARKFFSKEATPVDRFKLGKANFSVKIKVDGEQYRKIEEYKTGLTEALARKLFPKELELTNIKFLGSAINEEETIRKCLVNRNFSIAAKIERGEKGYEEFQKNIKKILQKENEGNKFDSKSFERKLNIYVGQFTKDVRKAQPNIKDVGTPQDSSFQKDQPMAHNSEGMKKVAQYDKTPESFIGVDKDETTRKYNRLVYSSTDIQRIIIDRIPRALSPEVENNEDRKNFFNKDPENCVSFVFKNPEEANIFSTSVKYGGDNKTVRDSISGIVKLSNKIRNSTYVYRDEDPNLEKKSDKAYVVMVRFNDHDKDIVQAIRDERETSVKDIIKACNVVNLDEEKSVLIKSIIHDELFNKTTKVAPFFYDKSFQDKAQILFEKINEGKIDEHEGKEKFQEIVNETLSLNSKKSDKNAIIKKHIVREIRRELGITGKAFENNAKKNETGSTEILEKGILRALGKKLLSTNLKATLKKSFNAARGKNSYTKQ